MYKTTIGVEGMMCHNCERHVNEAVLALGVKKAESSHEKNQTEVLSKSPVDEAAVTAAIEGAGYKVTSFKTEEVKKGIFG